MYTQTITVKVDKNTKRLLDQISKETNKGKSEIIRKAITKYVNKTGKGAGASLLQMAEEAKKYKYSAPKDIVENMNKYLYGGKS